VAARKVAELGMRADIVAVADAGLIPKMLLPSHATWSAIFATNEIVLAHKDHSRFTDQIAAGNWAEVLLRDGVRLGRADPDTAPIGYQTLMVWQLAEAAGGAAPARVGGAVAEKCAHDRRRGRRLPCRPGRGLCLLFAHGRGPPLESSGVAGDQPSR
jgi:ABC-type molybdate transport system substrate-binding protein